MGPTQDPFPLVQQFDPSARRLQGGTGMATLSATQALCVSWGVPSTEAEPKRHVGGGVCPTVRQDPSATWV